MINWPLVIVIGSGVGIILFSWLIVELMHWIYPGDI